MTMLEGSISSDAWFSILSGNLLKVNLLFFFIKYLSHLLKSTDIITLTYFIYLMNLTMSNSSLIFLKAICYRSFFPRLHRVLWFTLKGLRVLSALSFEIVELSKHLCELSLSKIFWIRCFESELPKTIFFKAITKEPIAKSASAKPPISPKKSRGP